MCQQVGVLASHSPASAACWQHLRIVCTRFDQCSHHHATACAPQQLPKISTRRARDNVEWCAGQRRESSPSPRCPTEQIGSPCAAMWVHSVVRVTLTRGAACPQCGVLVQQCHVAMQALQSEWAPRTYRTAASSASRAATVARIWQLDQIGA
jgi:hypothetical protein